MKRYGLSIKKVMVMILCPICMGSVISQSALYGVHDPVMIKQDSTYYLFCTGWGISCFSSVDKVHWKSLAPVFNKPSDWAMQAVPGFKGHNWAPDVFFYKGKYWLLYSVSTFGKNNSCIGIAENSTLDPESADFRWIDHGQLICSVPGRDAWNAIDPNFILDKNGQPWLSFGSFWSGIKLIKLRKDLSGLEKRGKLYSLADRQNKTQITGKPGNGAIEAPFIYAHAGFYYLFVSFDYCCRGIHSNYKVMVGRSKKLTGPFLDKNDVPMLAGGGTPVLPSNARYPGVGHCGVYSFEGTDYIIFHGYDAFKNGRPRLLMEILQWDQQGWPFVDTY